MIFIKIKEPSSKIKGVLKRYFLQLDKNIFIGNVSHSKLNDLVEKVTYENCIIAVSNKNNIQGFDLHFFGSFEGKFKEVDGLLFRLTQKP